ncbi:hypothetical protein ACGFYY_15090 [Streptomyces sp. NPDC048331]|uniref:hypothetical protein n=1 Tax=Streptomyces sp. NPDC048331 TaxID=3365534 RepID=UPI003723649E
MRTAVAASGAPAGRHNRSGRSSGPAGVLAQEAAATPTRLVAGVHAALLRQTGGRLADDVALPALRDGRS